MAKKKLYAMKKWEVKSGKNRGLYIACTHEQAEKFFPEWGRLDDEYWSTTCLKRKHRVPEEWYILTHSIWARYVMRPHWEAIIIKK